ncbi:TPA: hypothetical protein ACH3X1_008564 [Trebouxia sp. C0004]
MAGKRGGMAARSGRGRTAQSLTGDTEVGQKRKAPDALLSTRKEAKANEANNAACHASARPGLTMTALQSTFRQQAGSLEAQVQEQSIAGLAGLVALEADLKRSAKADYQDSCKQLEDADKLLDFVEAEWNSDVKSLEKNCSSCVAAIRSSTSMLTRVQAVQDNFAQQLAQLLACNKVN